MFTFPIPTINITNDFDWDSEVINRFMDIITNTSRILPFINSDLNPEMLR